jgi:hypothetical protein
MPGGCLNPRQEDWQVQLDVDASKQQSIKGSCKPHSESDFDDAIPKRDQAMRAAKVTTPTTAGSGSALTWASSKHIQNRRLVYFHLLVKAINEPPEAIAIHCLV